MSLEEAMGLTFGLSYLVVVGGFIVFAIIDKFNTKGK